VTPEQIQEALYYAYGSRQVSTIFTPDNQYQVIMELAPRFQGDLTALRLLSVRSSNGRVVPDRLESRHSRRALVRCR
jgi:HAE1 family hydrophobic/amphiphilic exporter-1